MVIFSKLEPESFLFKLYNIERNIIIGLAVGKK